MLVQISKVNPDVTVYNDHTGIVVLANTNDVLECIGTDEETGLTEDQIYKVFYHAYNISFNCQDTQSFVAKVGHDLFAEYFPEGV